MATQLTPVRAFFRRCIAKVETEPQRASLCYDGCDAQVAEALTQDLQMRGLVATHLAMGATDQLVWAAKPPEESSTR